MSKRGYVSPDMSRKTFYNQCTFSKQSFNNETAKLEREAYEYQVRKHGEPEQDWSEE